MDEEDPAPAAVHSTTVGSYQKGGDGPAWLGGQQKVGDPNPSTVKRRNSTSTSRIAAGIVVVISLCAILFLRGIFVAVLAKNTLEQEHQGVDTIVVGESHQQIVGMAPSKDNDDSADILVSGFQNIGKEAIDQVRQADAQASPLVLRWYCPPDGWPEPSDPNVREGRDGWWKRNEKDNELVVAAPAKKDFWRRTYYSPVLVKDDGPCLLATLPWTTKADAASYTVETSFTLHPKRQFDQAGLVVRLDHDHWLKTGIEVVDGVPRLSCVVTNVYSDWSTQIWSHKEAKIRMRLSILPRGSFVVEARPITSSRGDGTSKKGDDNEEEWTFVRIAHLSRDTLSQDEDPLALAAEAQAWTGPAAPPGHLWVGVFAASPEDQGGSHVTFHDFSIVRGSTFSHNADGNAE